MVTSPKSHPKSLNPAVLTTGWLIHRVRAFPVRTTETLVTYAIGYIVAYWTIERVAGFW